MRPETTGAAAHSGPMRSGVLITTKNGTEIGRERYSDDGDALTSEVRLGGPPATITITRKSRHVRVEASGQTIERDVPAGTVVLENGSWQAYALAAEGMKPGDAPTPVKVLLPVRGVTVDGSLAVSARAEGGQRIAVVIHGLAVEVEVDAGGKVMHASVPAQSLEARAEGDPAARAPETRPSPAAVLAEPVELERGGVALRGELWMPKAHVARMPVVLFIAGSGPTDRDGNNATGLQTDAYRMIAEALATRGVASLRYDKRGVGQSGGNFDFTKVTIDDFAEDALAIARRLRKDPRFSSLALLGHSEGGLIALLIAPAAAPDSLLLLATAGRPVAVILREQLGRSLDAKALSNFDQFLAALRKGDAASFPASPVIFPPAVYAFLRSELDIDPVRLLEKVKVKTAILQGERDVQVLPGDARLLAAAGAGAKMTLFPTMSHTCKEEASSSLPQASYSDPTKPLAPGLIDAIVAGVNAR